MLNWLVVGVGDITRKRVIPAIQAEPRSRLYGIVTRNPDKALPYRVRVWTSLEEALCDSTIQVVYVASPVFLHAPQTIQSLRAGKHVICEKPMAINLSDAQAMLDAAAESRKSLGTAYYRRAYPKVLRAKKLLESGAIGKPVVAELTSHSWLDGHGSRAWLVDPAQSGGGPLYDIGSHRIDLLNYFFGEPVRAIGSLSNAVHTYSVEDNATVVVDYPNGVRGIVDVRWHSKVVRDECRIRGTDGEIDMTPLNGPELIYPGGHESLAAHSNLHFPIIQNAADSFLDGAPLLSTGVSSIWTDWVTERVGRNSASWPVG